MIGFERTKLELRASFALKSIAYNSDEPNHEKFKIITKQLRKFDFAGPNFSNFQNRIEVNRIPSWHSAVSLLGCGLCKSFL